MSGPGGVSRPVVGVGEEPPLVRFSEIQPASICTVILPRPSEDPAADVLERHPPAEIHPVDEDVDLLYVRSQSSDAIPMRREEPVVEAALVLWIWFVKRMPSFSLK